MTTISVVTGANSGIGEAIARRLAEDGAKVMLVARNETTLAEVAASFASAGHEARWVSADLNLADGGEVVVAATLAAYGRVDILVNCASATISAPFMSFTDEQWLAGFGVKVHGAIRLFYAAWPQLKATKGMVINIGGVGARTPRANRGMTGILSAALMAVTKMMADVGLKEGVRVNMINPGSVITPRTVRNLTIRAEQEGITYDELLARQAREWSALRVGYPEDTANLAAYILSPAGSLLHGSIIDLDGGTTKGL